MHSSATVPEASNTASEAAITAWLAKRLVKTKFVSLPNILADKPLVKEFLLEECTAENLATELSRLLNSDTSAMTAEFSEMHQWIRKDADKQASDAILNLVGK